MRLFVRIFKKISKIKFAKVFARTIFRNAAKDASYFNGEGSEKKANDIYSRIKNLLIGGWNKIIDKIISLFLNSAKKDLNDIVVKCNESGENPLNHFPDNVKDKLGEDFANNCAFAI